MGWGGVGFYIEVCSFFWFLGLVIILFGRLSVGKQVNFEVSSVVLDLGDKSEFDFQLTILFNRKKAFFSIYLGKWGLGYHSSRILMGIIPGSFLHPESGTKVVDKNSIIKAIAILRMYLSFIKGIQPLRRENLAKLKSLENNDISEKDASDFLSLLENSLKVYDGFLKLLPKNGIKVPTNKSGL